MGEKIIRTQILLIITWDQLGTENSILIKNKLINNKSQGYLHSIQNQEQIMIITNNIKSDPKRYSKIL